MPIVGGLDIHRKQLTFDYLDTVTGEVRRGQVARPTGGTCGLGWRGSLGRDRRRVRDGGVHRVAVCRRGAGRGRDRCACGRAGRHRFAARAASGMPRPTKRPTPRALAAAARFGRGPAAGVLGPASADPGVPGAAGDLPRSAGRAHRLGAAHPRGVSSTRAPPRWARARCAPGRAWPRCASAAAAHLSPGGQLQVATALDMLAAVETRMEMLRAQLRHAARHLTGAKVLAARLYGVGPLTALALTCWLAGAGRFSSSRKAVRFAGLDVTVWSSDRKGPPGRLSRQGPPVLRWALYGPARPTPALRPPTTPTTPLSGTARTVSAPPCPRPARSSGRPATSWPNSATTPSPPPDTPHRHPWSPAPRRTGPGQARRSHTSPDGEPPRPAPASRCQPLPALPPRATRAA